MVHPVKITISKTAAALNLNPRPTQWENLFTQITLWLLQEHWHIPQPAINKYVFKTKKMLSQKSVKE